MKNVLKVKVDVNAEDNGSELWLATGEVLPIVGRTGRKGRALGLEAEEVIVSWQGKVWSLFAPVGAAMFSTETAAMFADNPLDMVEVEPVRKLATVYREVERPVEPGRFDLVRPSSLPKLAQCRCFMGSHGTSPAAARGTLLDGIIRQKWEYGCCDEVPAPEDAEAVDWALETLHMLCGEGAFEVITDEARLRVGCPVPGVAVGTMDACCPEGGWLADFKTGQVRGYREQMAAYALGCMLQYGADEWTAHLLFVDQKLVESIHFTATEAQELVRGIVAAPREPRLCEYCGWCANQHLCPVQKAALAEVVQAADELPAITPALKSRPEEWPASIRTMMEEPENAWNFLRLYGVAKGWAEAVSAHLKAGEPDERYFKRIMVSGTRKVLPGKVTDEMLDGWGRAGVKALLGIMPAVALRDFEAVWKELEGDRPVPEEMVGMFGGSVQLRLNKAPKVEGGAA